MFRTDLLNQKTIFITGGGTGLGKAMATRFAELGANVVIASRKPEVLEAAALEISWATGAEWIGGAGEFNWLEAVTPDQWDELKKTMRANR